MAGMDSISCLPVPVLELRDGAWRCAIADPRSDPLALGARFVHGGYIAGWWHHDRPLIGCAIDHWDPYYGMGLPEVFEWSLGQDYQGDRRLRIGAGSVCHHRPGNDALQTLTGSVSWRLVEQSAQHCRWRCDDSQRIGEHVVGYRLERTVRLQGPTLLSQTELTVRCPWSEPVIWFPHPYLPQADGDGTVVDLPSGATIAGQRAARWQPAAEGGFAVATGVWGYDGPIQIGLDPRLGGGRLTMQLDRPIDKLVLWANHQASAVEPYLARAWAAGETATWSLRYRAALD